MYGYGLYSYGLYSYGLYSYGLYSYGLCSYGLYIVMASIVMALYSYGLYSYDLFSCVRTRQTMCDVVIQYNLTGQNDVGHDYMRIPIQAMYPHGPVQVCVRARRLSEWSSPM